jgi:hypothetical protein
VYSLLPICDVSNPCHRIQEELVRSAAFRYISDAITREEALAMLKAKEAGKKEREAKVVELGYSVHFSSWRSFRESSGILHT